MISSAVSFVGRAVHGSGIGVTDLAQDIPLPPWLPQKPGQLHFQTCALALQALLWAERIPPGIGEGRAGLQTRKAGRLPTLQQG